MALSRAGQHCSHGHPHWPACCVSQTRLCLLRRHHKVHPRQDREENIIIAHTFYMYMYSFGRIILYTCTCTLLHACTVQCILRVCRNMFHVFILSHYVISLPPLPSLPSPPSPPLLPSPPPLPSPPLPPLLPSPPFPPLRTQSSGACWSTWCMVCCRWARGSPSEGWVSGCRRSSPLLLAGSLQQKHTPKAGTPTHLLYVSLTVCIIAFYLRNALFEKFHQNALP